ncbi:MAG: hypothetical protein NTU98_10415 [Bacteroidetes bacterium]|nr:hypothetical protein [Bacteroidota bacterium]
MRKLFLLLILATMVSCLERQQVCPAGPYQVATINITGDSLIPGTDFVLTTYNQHNFDSPVDTAEFSADNQGHLAYELWILGKYDYILLCDTLKIRDTITDIVEIRDDCGNSVVALDFKLNGKLVTNRTITVRP